MMPQPTIIMRKDLLNLLRSTLQANERMSAQFRSDEMEQYCNGFRDAILAIATACDFDLREDAYIVPATMPMLSSKKEAYR